MREPVFRFAKSDEEAIARLAEPFAGCDVRVREGKYKYAKPRVYMNRLDDVLGPPNWEDTYTVGPDGSFWCHLKVVWPSGKITVKSDTGDCKAMPDDSDTDKGASSDAFKRACVKYGPGRYLYEDRMPDYVILADTFDPHAYVPDGDLHFDTEVQSAAGQWMTSKVVSFKSRLRDRVKELGVWDEYGDDWLDEHSPRKTLHDALDAFLGRPDVFAAALLGKLGRDREAVEAEAKKVLTGYWKSLLKAHGLDRVAPKAGPEPAQA